MNIINRFLVQLRRKASGKIMWIASWKTDWGPYGWLFLRTRCAFGKLSKTPLSFRQNSPGILTLFFKLKCYTPHASIYCFTKYLVLLYLPAAFRINRAKNCNHTNKLEETFGKFKNPAEKRIKAYTFS